MKSKLTRWPWFFVALACLSCQKSQAPLASEGKEAWNSANDPYKFIEGDHFETVFSKLPGGLNMVMPVSAGLYWSGSTWPSYQGGLSYRWAKEGVRTDKERYQYPLMTVNEAKRLSSEEIAQLSPAEKFDLYLDLYDFPFTQTERQRTEVLTRTNFQSWESLSHAWAFASVSYLNPAPVTMTNHNGIEIPFGSSDIKGLLAGFLNYNRGATRYFVGTKCNKNFRAMKENLSPADYEVQIRSSECRDINAGSFHIALANHIGIQKQPFMADLARDQAVWNRPILGFASNVIKEDTEISEFAAPGTERELLIHTTLFYMAPQVPTWQRKLLEFEKELSQATYEYTLELNRFGEIVGGEWLTEDRPDFLWKSTLPEFSGDFAALADLYQAAVVDLPRKHPVEDLKITIDEDTSATIQLTASDRNGEALTYRMTSKPDHGKASLNGHDLYYRPAADYNGKDSLTYVLVRDGRDIKPEGRVDFVIEPVEDLPVARDYSVEMSFREAEKWFDLPCWDHDGDGLYAEVSPPIFGDLRTRGKVIYYAPHPVRESVTEALSYTCVDSKGNRAALAHLEIKIVVPFTILAYDEFTSGNRNGGQGWLSPWSLKGHAEIVRYESQEAASPEATGYRLMLTDRYAQAWRSFAPRGAAGLQVRFRARADSFNLRDGIRIGIKALNDRNYTTLFEIHQQDITVEDQEYIVDVPVHFAEAEALKLMIESRMDSTRDQFYVGDLEIVGRP